ncbi:dTDP-4-dehydrorhamnose reductase [Alkalicoccobacillus porphyridii]|uniref:dTDP-4-dehydrorhamnose reductase n=1 Tax=Alkalicoccobacillus porphyridii TaxID=2597270 RepID=A0A553ZXB6_9BACI|nr:dTDP-4-dehydrorhamnose reductase [Alkalicoccobacillus porphyridii]TSB46092.1 dTDP-4-dehydrorhamnose reductase [Alkalicoccobacillus porphyridii]
MRIVITGANGRLAKAFIRFLNGETIYALTKEELDCTNRLDVIQTINRLNPDLILHCAAMTDVDACEQDPMKAFSINSLSVQYVAEASGSCPLFIFSSDYIFSTNFELPYTELNQPSPSNVYALSKWLAEEHVRYYPNVYIIRTSWLFGGHGDFIDKIINKAEINNEIAVVNDQIGTPTYIHDLVQWVWTLQAYPPGTYHLVNSGFCSRYEWAAEIISTLTLNAKLKSIQTEKLLQIAMRPNRSVLSAEKFVRMTGQPMRSWKEALKEYLLETYR